MQHLCRKHFITANRASLAILLLQTAATLSFLRNWLISNLAATVLGGKDFENRGRLISEDVLNAQSESVVSPPSVANDNLFIIPLEDVVGIAMLAGLYCRSPGYMVLVNVEDAVEILRSETMLAISASRVPGSVPAEIIKSILSPESHGGVSIADILIMLGHWVRCGSVIHLPFPATWVVPVTRYT